MNMSVISKGMSGIVISILLALGAHTVAVACPPPAANMVGVAKDGYGSAMECNKGKQILKDAARANWNTECRAYCTGHTPQCVSSENKETVPEFKCYEGTNPADAQQHHARATTRPKNCTCLEPSKNQQSSVEPNPLAEHEEFTRNAYAKAQSGKSGLVEKRMPAVRCLPTAVGGTCCRNGTFGCSWDKDKFIRCGEEAC